MPATCHRCSGTLGEEDSFCPHCGAPQLRVAPQQESDELTSGGGMQTPDVRAGALAGSRDRRAVDWPRVIRLAVVLAVPIGLLSLLFPPLVLLAPMLVISLYRRGRPGTSLDARSGFRIGTLTGLLSSYIWAFGLAGWQLFQRYSLHQGPTIDQQYVIAMQQWAETTQRMTASNPVSAEQIRAFLKFFLSPDGKASVTMFNTAASASGIVLIAGLGGLLGAKLSRRAAQTFRQP